MPKHRTEQVYDEEMMPHVSRLIEIARQESIPLLIAAGMTMENGEPGGCLTSIPDGSMPGYSNRLGLCAQIIRGDQRFDRAKSLMITSFHDPAPSDFLSSTPIPIATGDLLLVTDDPTSIRDLDNRKIEVRPGQVFEVTGIQRTDNTVRVQLADRNSHETYGAWRFFTFELGAEPWPVHFTLTRRDMAKTGPAGGERNRAVQEALLRFRTAQGITSRVDAAEDLARAVERLLVDPEAA